MKWWRVLAEGRADELWAHGAVAVEHACGHFVHPDEAQAAAAALGAAIDTQVPDWAEEWLAQHDAVSISARIKVAPSWVSIGTGISIGAEIVLRVDPGLAFGTGSHPTTRLCLKALEHLVRPGMRVLDLGTGTGILGICALKLGASAALGTDIDDIALRTAARLARRHGVPLQVARKAEGQFDLVLANLPVEAQESLAPRAAAHVAPGGTLLVSGFLAGVPVERLYPRMDVTARDEQEGWGLLRLTPSRDKL